MAIPTQPGNHPGAGRVGWREVLPQVGALLAMATVFGSVGAIRLQRQLSGR